MQSLANIELSFRVSFDTRSLRGKDSKIGNGQNLVQLIVLNLPSTLCHRNPAHQWLTTPQRPNSSPPSRP